MVPRVATTIGDGPRSTTIGQDDLLDHPQRARIAGSGHLDVDQAGRARCDDRRAVTAGKVSPVRPDRHHGDQRPTGAVALVAAAVVLRVDRLARHRAGAGRGRHRRGRGGTLARRAFALDRAGPGAAGAPPPCSRPGGLRHADGPHVGGPAQGAAGAADPRRRGRSGGGAPTEPPRRDRRHRRAGAEWHLVHRVRRARRLPIRARARVDTGTRLRSVPFRPIDRHGVRRGPGPPSGTRRPDGGRFGERRPLRDLRPRRRSAPPPGPFCSRSTSSPTSRRSPTFPRW